MRYYPEGKTPLLIARGVGPARTNPCSTTARLPMQAFGQGDLRFLLPAEEPGVVRLQLGEDNSPLQLERSFRVEPRAGLPRAEVMSPTTADGRAPGGRPHASRRSA